MNKISIANSISKTPKAKMGQIWVRRQHFYIVAKKPEGTDLVLVNLKDGNIWSSSSLFGNTYNSNEFSLFTGTLTLEVNND